MSRDFWLLGTIDPALLRNSKITLTSFKKNLKKILDVAHNINFKYFVSLVTQKNKLVNPSIYKWKIFFSDFVIFV
jgi:hypothetical protein